MLRLALFAPLFALTLLGCGNSGCGSRDDGNPSARAAAEEPPPLEFASSRAPFVNALADLDEEIVATRQLADAQPKGWLVLERVAGLYLRRAKLSGDYGDYGKAEEVLNEAFARAPEGTGPVLTRAALNLSMHRIDRVEADLDRMAAAIIVDDPTKAVIAGMRGDLAMQRGDYEQAAKHLAEALALDRNVNTLSRQGLLLWQTGDYEAAETHYRDALASIVGDAPDAKAWIHLQLGLMDLDRGRYEDAFAHYRDGAEELSGWWLLDEHIAEICMLTGRTSQATKMYEDIVERTGKGEFMDALAEIAKAGGDEAGAKQWIDRSRERFEAELKTWPEASYGHALGHFLAFGPPERALELAQKNHALRPNVEAKRDLAEARLASGDVAGAKQVIDEALATPVKRADVLWIASEVYTAQGDAARAAELRTAAEAINPKIASE
jgi:tetratricopeptide (TPR) repeat protein